MPFTDGERVKEAFLNRAEVLFDGLSNKDATMPGIKDSPPSTGAAERRITEILTTRDNASEQ